MTQTSVPELMLRFLQYQRALEGDTKVFNKEKHNADLCPKWQRKIESILYAYGRFTNIVYDTQGIRDDGSDIILRYGESENKIDSTIAFQVKSFDDMSKSDYLYKLKAQRDDSFRKVKNLKSYFIVLCTDEKIHKDRIRMIEAEFRTADRTLVIEPTYTYSFLNIPDHRIHAVVKRTLDADDIVWKRAIEAIEFPSISARLLSVYISLQWVAGRRNICVNDLLRSNELMNFYEKVREKDEQINDQILFEEQEDEIDPDSQDGFDLTLAGQTYDERLAFDLEIIEQGVIAVNSSNGEIVVFETQLLPIIALITDAMARYDYQFNDVLPYMLDMLGILDY